VGLGIKRKIKSDSTPSLTLVFGGSGSGKTELTQAARNPLCFNLEKSRLYPETLDSNDFDNVIKNRYDILDFIRELAKVKNKAIDDGTDKDGVISDEGVDISTIIIDSFDVILLEIENEVLNEYTTLGGNTVNAIGDDFGKPTEMFKSKMRDFLTRMKIGVCEVCGIDLILICKTEFRKISLPNKEPFDGYLPPVPNIKCWNALTELTDHNFFITKDPQIHVHRDNNNKEILGKKNKIEDVVSIIFTDGTSGSHIPAKHRKPRVLPSKILFEHHQFHEGDDLNEYIKKVRNENKMLMSQLMGYNQQTQPKNTEGN